MLHVVRWCIGLFMVCFALMVQAEGFEAVKSKAEQGDAKAQNSLGNMYHKGRGVKPNGVEASKWYRKAAEQGNTDAQCSLGWMYYCGVSVAKNELGAVKWFRKAAEQGDESGLFSLELMATGNAECGEYASLDEFRKGRAAAIEAREGVISMNRKAAEQGHATAQYILGVVYLSGWGVAQNDAEAVNWFRKAAEQGNADAQNNLGRMYANGRGVAKDDAEATKWYSKAAEQGSMEAKNALDAMKKQPRKPGFLERLRG
ncbi:MAG: sel1 repeat family protein [Burkholderiales bacterium]|jgi:TPR repeat protein|nr:sel1 repeat family protein [Burkholderiales bacterium]